MQDIIEELLQNVDETYREFHSGLCPNTDNIMGVRIPKLREIAKRNLQLVQEQKIRNHKLGNSAPMHSGEIEEQECERFCDFLKSRNCFFVENLRGTDNA